MLFPVESSAEKIIHCAHPINGDSIIFHSQLEIVLFGRVFREENKVVNINPDVDGFVAISVWWEIGEAWGLDNA
jgi:hypothetical protein